jgi:V8-like Glu-specific endopeptidase
MNTQRITALGAAAAIGCLMATTAHSQVRVSGATTTIAVPNRGAQSASGIDFAHAKPLPLPAARALPPSARGAINRAVDPMLLFGPPGGEPGGLGDGQENPIQLVAPQKIPQGSGVGSDEYGTSNQPFTTSEVNAFNDKTYKYYPFRAAGKLFFKIGASSYLCSASLIKPGIVVTAAHCVANYGKSQFYSNWTYVPGYNNGTAPYGTWNAASARVLTAYYNGTDNCAQYGVICPDDVALLTLTPSNGKYAGTTTGWFGYGYNGYGYNGSSQILINQLGYPVDLDGGLLMQRNDSQGFVNTGFSNNTIIGSLMTGGSSGGPWLVNLGQAPALSGGDTFGTYAGHNAVVGVTSWGYTNLAVKQQGAAPFTSNNIAVLVSADCTATPGAC